MFFVLSNAAFAAPKEPKVIREKKFDSEIKNASDSRVVVTEKEMIFLDADGNVAKKKALPKYSKIEFSKDGTRIGQYTAYDVTEKGPGRSEFKMLDENGEELWTTDSLKAGYGISQINGGTVVEDDCNESSCGNKIIIRDKQNPKGMVIAVDAISKSMSYFKISEDGNYFVAYYNELTRHSDITGQSAIVFYDISGNLVWKKHFDEAYIRKIEISTNGNYVVAIIDNAAKRISAVNFFNKTGELILKEPVNFVGSYLVKFDKDEKHAFVTTSAADMYLFNMNTRKLEWNYSGIKDMKDMYFGDIDISAGFIAAGVLVKNNGKGQNANSPKYLYLFDSSGTLILKKKFIEHGFHSWSYGPKVKLLDFGRQISVQLYDTVIELENEFAN